MNTKGNTTKAGRKKGIPNRLSKNTKELITNFFDEKMKDIDDIWSKATAGEKLIFLGKMATLIVPRPAEEIVKEEKNKERDFSQGILARMKTAV